MFSSPSPRKSKEAPAKTPRGWGAAFGIFSTAKKPPPSTGTVESGTLVTGMMNGDLSAVVDSSFRSERSNSLNDSLEPFMSPISSPSPEKSTGSLLMTGGSIANGGGNTRTSRLDFSALSSRMSATRSDLELAGAPSNQLALSNGDHLTLRNGKSPWHSRQNTTTGFSANLSVKSPWQGSRSRRNRRSEATAKPLTFFSTSTSERTRRYRPNAMALVRSNRRCAEGEFDQDRVNQTLAALKDSYLSEESQLASANVYAVRGKVQWGSSSRPNRLPRPSQKRQRSLQDLQQEAVEEGNEHEGTSRKRRKKVSFDQESDSGDAIVTRIAAATPFSKSAGNRKGTPMPSRFNQSTPATAGDSLEDEEMEDQGSETEARPSGNDNLPEAPRRLEFPTAKLDSDEPVAVDFSTSRSKAQSLDSGAPDPMVKDLDLGWKKHGQVSREASRSFTTTSEFNQSRYNRPPSPIRERKKTKFGDDDDDKSEHATKRSKFNQNEEEEAVPDWACECGTVNNNDDSKCSNCDKARKADPNGPTGWGNLFQDQKSKWKCESCHLHNDQDVYVCIACEVGVKPGETMESAKAKEMAKNKAAAPAPATTMTSGTSFSFGSNASSENKFTFGTSGSTPSLPVPTGKPTESKFEFPSTSTTGSSNSSSGFTFGSTPTAAAGTTGGFSFGGTPAPAADSSKSGGFVFGGSASLLKSDDKDKDGDDNSKPNFTFAAPSTSAPAPEPAPPTGGFIFGSTQPSNSSTTAPSFVAAAPVPATEVKTSSGSADSKVASTLSATAKPFSLTSSSGENGDKKPATGFSGLQMDANEQDAANKEAKPAPASVPAFGSVKSPGESTTTATSTSNFVFGQSHSTPALAPAPVETKPAAPAGTFSFGSASASAPAASSFSFGGTPAPAENNDTKTKRQRGYDLNGGKPEERKAPEQSPAPAPTLFGAPALSTASGPTSSAAVFKFGNISADGAAPSVGQAPAAPSTGGMPFGSPQASSAAPPASSSTFVFGSTPAPAPTAVFGSTSNAPAPVIFGSGPGSTGAPSFASAPPSSGSSFGTAGPAASMAFGTAPLGQSFGGPTPTPAPEGFGGTSSGASGMNFGTTSAPAPPSTFGTAAPATFGFGGTSSGFAAAKPPTATPGGGASFGNSNFGGQQPFGSQPPVATTPGFNGTAFGNSAPGGFATTPAPPSGFASNNFGAPQTGGFLGSSTPAPTNFGGGFGATAPQTAPQPGGGGFALGTSGPKSNKGRRIVRAKRPTRA